MSIFEMHSSNILSRFWLDSQQMVTYPDSGYELKFKKKHNLLISKLQVTFIWRHLIHYYHIFLVLKNALIPQVTVYSILISLIDSVFAYKSGHFSALNAAFFLFQSLSETTGPFFSLSSLPFPSTFLQVFQLEISSENQ